MVKTSVEIKNNRLLGFGYRLKAAANKVGREAAETVAEQAKVMAPKDTGELIDSIKAQQDGQEWVVVAATDHAGFVEFGTVHMPAQPYLTPAAEQMRGPFIRRMSSAVEDAA